MMSADVKMANNTVKKVLVFIVSIFTLPLFFSACDSTSVSDKGLGVDTVVVGMKKNNVITLLQKGKYSFTTENSQDPTSVENAEVIFCQYKPIAPYDSVHKDWMESYFELVFIGEILREINWKDKNGQVIEKELGEINISTH